MKKMIVVIISSMLLFGCTKSDSKLNGTVLIDGSSTVAPITEAAIEEFALVNPNVDMIMGVSGTGGGFKRFTIGETEISNASRPIKKDEDAIAKQNNVEYYELEIAKDAITVVVNKKNDWVESLTIEQLQSIFRAGNEGIKWSDLDPSWPNKVIKIYSPSHDSGTYDYFNEVIIGKDHEHREDVTMATNGNVLVGGVMGDKYSIGYFGYVYYVDNAKHLNLLKINDVLPTDETILSGAYEPLSRPLYLYVNKQKFNENSTLSEFVKFYLEEAELIVGSVGYVPLKQEDYTKQLEYIGGKNEEVNK